MDKMANKSVLRSGRSPKMPVKAVTKSEISGKAYSSQHVAATDGHCAKAADVGGSADASAYKAEIEAKRRFDAWRAKYEPVAREIYEKRRRRAESKRRRAIARRKAFGDLCEMTDGLASFCRKNNVSLAEGEWMLDQFRRPGPYAAVFVTMFFDIAWFGAVFLRRELTRRIDRAKHEALRPYYYGQEKARRQAMAEERRRIRRRSTRNACPTREEIINAWKRVKDSNEDLLRFGSLMEDLECYVDNSLVRDDSGAIIGRRSGIKGWLQMEIPALYTVYSRVMAYKAAAKRMRQIIELQDPLPLSSVLDMGKESGPEIAVTQDYCAESGRQSSTTRCVVMDTMISESDEVALLRARAIYLEVIRPVGEGARKRTALIERMAKLTDFDSIEDVNMLETWRRKYEHKITVRTKSMWGRRLVKMLA